MDYQYFVALTAEVERLVARLAALPGGFIHAGMDLRHVFARRVYIVASDDAALYRLFALQRGLPAPPPRPFKNDLVRLLAESWFGIAPSPRARLERLLKPLRRALGRGLGARPPAQKGRDLLLFADSVRIARFLAPIAGQFPDRCAFLVRQQDRGLRDWLERNGHAAILVGRAAPGLRKAAAPLARHMPGAVLEAEEFEAALAQARPRAVVLAEGNAPVDETLARVGGKLGVPVVCVQQGWSPLVHTCFRNMSFAAMALWGEGFGDILAPENPGQAFLAAGNFHLAPPSPSPRAGIVFFGVGSNGWLGDDDEADLVRLAARVARAMPQVPVVFRPHPRDPISEALLAPLRALPNVRFSGPDDALGELLARARVGISIYSSTILECAASGVVPVIFNPTTMPHYLPDVAAVGAGVEVKTAEAAFQAIQGLLRSDAATDAFQPALAAFQARYFARRGPAALCFLREELERLMA